MMAEPLVKKCRWEDTNLDHNPEKLLQACIPGDQIVHSLVVDDAKQGQEENRNGFVPPSAEKSDQRTCELLTQGQDEQVISCEDQSGKVTEEDLPLQLRDLHYLPQDSRRATQATQADFAEFDEMILRFMDEHTVPGLSVAISHKGKIVYTQCYGYATHGVPLCPRHLFRIASISKILTAVGIMRLYEEGLLKLTDKVFGRKGILREYTPCVEGDRRVLRITVKHLLQHSAGWDRELVGDPVFWKHVGTEMGVPNPVPNSVLFSYMMKQKLQFSPGTKYVYSNLGYVVLGHVIERVSGSTYETYIKNLLREINITNIELGKSLRKDAHVDEVEYFASVPYRNVESIFPGSGRVIAPYGAYCMETGQGDGGWIAAPRDLLHLINCLEGFGSHRILKLSTFKLMLERPSYAKGSCWYGLGLDVSWYRKAWEHGGNVDGATGCLTRSNSGLTWAILCNYWPLDSDYTSLVSYGLSRVPTLSKVNHVKQHSLDFMTLDKKFALNIKLPEKEFERVKSAVSSQGYRVCWFDAYDVQGRSHFNVIWVRDDKPGKCRHDLLPGTVEGIVMTEQHQGYRPVHINTYHSDTCVGNHLRFCVVFIKDQDLLECDINDKLPLHGLESEINKYSDRLYKLKCQSVYHDENNKGFVAVLFMKTNDPGQWPKHDLTIDKYERQFQQQSRYGHLPSYLKCYVDPEGQLKISCIWIQTGAFLYTAEHDMSAYRVLNDLSIVSAKKFHPICVFGYELQGAHKFGVVCVKEVGSSKK